VFVTLLVADVSLSFVILNLFICFLNEY
jgi:hypothetical protein